MATLFGETDTHTDCILWVDFFGVWTLHTHACFSSLGGRFFCPSSEQSSSSQGGDDTRTVARHGNARGYEIERYEIIRRQQNWRNQLSFPSLGARMTEKKAGIL